MDKQNTNIYTTLLEAQKEMGPVFKNATNPAFKSKYAELSSVIDTISETLNKYEIVFYQPLKVIDGEQYIETVLMHAESGTDISSLYKVVCKDATNPQAVGGGITYGRRYSLLSILGLAPEDDDGNLASQASQGASQPVRTASKPTASKAKESDGYYNEYEKKTYYPEPCEVCGREVSAKSVSFSHYKYQRTLCYDDQQRAESGELDDPKNNVRSQTVQEASDELDSLFKQRSA